MFIISDEIISVVTEYNASEILHSYRLSTVFEKANSHCLNLVVQHRETPFQKS